MCKRNKGLLLCFILVLIISSGSYSTIAVASATSAIYTPGDFNGDGKTDVIITNSTGSYWYISTGTGNSYIPVCNYSRSDLTLGNVQFTPGNFGGDGKTDVIITNSTGSYWYISTGTGNNYDHVCNYTRSDLTLGNVNYTAGNFGGDLKTDVIITNSTGSYWYISTGTGNDYDLSCNYTRADLTLGNVRYTPGNFAGDSKSDTIITNSTGSYWYISTGTGNNYDHYCDYNRPDLTI